MMNNTVNVVGVYDAGMADGKRQRQPEIDDLQNELSALRAREQALREALQPFTHPDLQRTLGGNIDGDASVVFVRGDAELTLGDFRRAALAAAGERDEAREEIKKRFIFPKKGRITKVVVNGEEKTFDPPIELDADSGDVIHIPFK